MSNKKIKLYVLFVKIAFIYIIYRMNKNAFKFAKKNKEVSNFITAIFLIRYIFRFTIKKM